LTACSGTTSDLGRVCAACRPWPSLHPLRPLYPPCSPPASMYHCPVAQPISRTPLIKDFPSSAVWPGGSSTHVLSFIVVVQASVCLARAPTEGRDRGVSKKGGRPRGPAGGAVLCSRRRRRRRRRLSKLDHVYSHLSLSAPLFSSPAASCTPTLSGPTRSDNPLSSFVPLARPSPSAHPTARHALCRRA
jgi:hypothetical protein